ncbi:polysaccharide deacetylase family protein [Candidatus Peregrinibacteria bacterium]|nr:polysaccharide deacetylase family protein [Candidatus Peregrinibacteria bacterium]
MKKFYLILVALLIFGGGALACTTGRIDKVVVDKKTAVLPDTETKIPIIMYHYVRVVDAKKDPLGYNLSINPPDFEKQMKYLKDQGYTTIHLADLIDGKVPKKAIVLSFDDGLEDFYTTALPILQKYGFTASDAVITGMIGAHEHMTDEQIRGSIKAGIEITSHTIKHLDLPKQTAAEIKKQLVESKNYLEKTFGLTVVGFIYPSGKFNDAVVQALKDAGYKIAATTQYGEADLAKNKMLLLPRVRIDNRDGYNGFVKKLEVVAK